MSKSVYSNGIWESVYLVELPLKHMPLHRIYKEYKRKATMPNSSYQNKILYCTSTYNLKIQYNKGLAWLYFYQIGTLNTR